MKFRRHIFVLLLLVCILSLTFYLRPRGKANSLVQEQNNWWEVQSVDTMKFSRDLAREKAKDSLFDKTIEANIKLISEMGATHVAIGTPYDEEFLPFMKRWVNYARQYKLKVWFRGNFSGWENWFEYEDINANEHIQRTKEFILQNPDIFEDGDIFTSCPECENGQLGDPREDGRATEFKNFILSEYKITTDSFNQIGKRVKSNYYSMNGDVASLIMDKDTTNMLSDVVVVDHYVMNTDKYQEDVIQYAKNSEGNVVLGEFGVPIPDLHGQMTEDEQSRWLKDLLLKLVDTKEVKGLNYWVLEGGTTSLLNNDGSKRKAIDTISSFYKPRVVTKKIINDFGLPVRGAKVSIGIHEFTSDFNGQIRLLLPPNIDKIAVEARGYNYYSLSIADIDYSDKINISPKGGSLIPKLIEYIRSLR